MSIHKSLKGLDELVRARNVLNRYERLLLLKQKGLWKEEENSILGLPKVRIMRLKKRPKVKEEKPAEGVAAEGAVAAEGEAEVKKEPEKIKKERAEKGEKVEKEKKEKKEK
jgi:small basic protein (TIGR04137 family)